MKKALLRQIKREAERIRDKILQGEKPALRFPLRSLSSVRFDPRAGMFKIGRKTKERTLAVSTVKTFA
jgi:DNA topoisomerase VI subunit A